MSNTPIAGAITPSDVSASSAMAAATPGHMPALDSAGASGAGPHVTKLRRTFPAGQCRRRTSNWVTSGATGRGGTKQRWLLSWKTADRNNPRLEPTEQILLTCACVQVVRACDGGSGHHLVHCSASFRSTRCCGCGMLIIPNADVPTS
jgi:hypothetical protein